MISRQSLREVGSEWPCSNPAFYLSLDALLADLLAVLAGSFLAAVLTGFADFFAVFDSFAFLLLPAAFDLLLCECFTGAR